MIFSVLDLVKECEDIWVRCDGSTLMGFWKQDNLYFTVEQIDNNLISIDYEDNCEIENFLLDLSQIFSIKMIPNHNNGSFILEIEYFNPDVDEQDYP